MVDIIPELNEQINDIFGLPEDLVECHQPKPILLPAGTVCLNITLL